MLFVPANTMGFLQKIPLNCRCKCVICLALEIVQNSYLHVDSSLSTFNMCCHMATQNILSFFFFFLTHCASFEDQSGIKVSVASGQTSHRKKQQNNGITTAFQHHFHKHTFKVTRIVLNIVYKNINTYL